MKFIITIDTEADNQWKNDGSLKLENLKYLERFQLLCDKFNFLPTYLITYEVASSLEINNLQSWKNDGKAEIGAHLHPWTTPPFDEFEKERNIQMFPNELPINLSRQKILNLTNKIQDVFGSRPTSFRAGRWGISEDIISYLIELGYLVDCSVTPKINWNKKDSRSPFGCGGPDFRGYSVNPDFFIINNKKSSLLEVPMTILYTGFFHNEDGKLERFFSKLKDESNFKKVFNFLFFQKKWLRVFISSSIQDWKAIYQSAQKNNLSVIEFMIHSSELMPGCSPYVKSINELEIIYKQIELMFDFFYSQGIEPCLLSDFAIQFNKINK